MATPKKKKILAKKKPMSPKQRRNAVARALILAAKKSSDHEDTAVCTVHTMTGPKDEMSVQGYVVYDKAKGNCPLCQQKTDNGYERNELRRQFENDLAGVNAKFIRENALVKELDEQLVALRKDHTALVDKLEMIRRAIFITIKHIDKAHSILPFAASIRIFKIAKWLGANTKLLEEVNSDYQGPDSTWSPK